MESFGLGPLGPANSRAFAGLVMTIPTGPSQNLKDAHRLSDINGQYHVVVLFSAGSTLGSKA